LQTLQRQPLNKKEFGNNVKYLKLNEMEFNETYLFFAVFLVDRIYPAFELGLSFVVF
jgi:hypothetical protein